MRGRLLAAVLAGLALAGCGGMARAGHRNPVSTRGHTAKSKTLRRHTSAFVRNATPQPSWHHYTGPVPILVYHELGNPPPGAPFPGLYVSDSDFAAEMAWLYANGYQAVTLDEVMSAWYHGGTLPRKPIVITFDNGYPPQITEAPDVMSRYGWPGVLNEITENHLDPEQIRSVLRIGWEVDSHSLTHPDLTELDSSELWAQVYGSREYLRKTFHIPVDSFCYPSSDYNAAVIAAVEKAGYTNAVTENAGYATSAEPYVLPRFEIEAGVSELSADLLDYKPADYPV